MSYKTLKSGSQPEFNYVKYGITDDPIGSINTYTDTSWKPYANNSLGPIPDAGVTAANDATGIIIGYSTANAIFGTWCLYMSKDANNRQGKGMSYPIKIKNRDKGQVLRGSIAYNIANTSGTYADGDVRVFVWDVANAKLIEPNPSILKYHTLASETFDFEFQTAYNSQDYRIIFHQATTTTASYGIQIDDIKVGKFPKTYGTTTTTLVPTPYTLTGSVSNPTKGTIVTDKCYTRQNGDYYEIQFNLYGQNGTNGSGVLLFNLPPGLVIDTNKVFPATNDDIASRVGDINIYNGSAGSHGHVYAYSSTQLAFKTLTDSSVYQTVNATFFNAANYMIQFTARVPILGWTSSTIASHDADTRVVAARLSYSDNATGYPITNSWTVMKWNVVSDDTHGSYNPLTGLYTVKVPGRFRISSTLTTASVNLATNQAIFIAVFKNGPGGSVSSYLDSDNGNGTSAIFVVSGSDTLECKAGDTFGIYTLCSVNTSTSITLDNSHMTVEMVSGPSQIMASESIDAHYQGVSYANLDNYTLSGTQIILKCNNLVKDSHGIYNSSTGAITIPASGQYEIEGQAYIDAQASADNQAVVFQLKSGATANAGGLQQSTIDFYKTGVNAGSVRFKFNVNALAGTVWSIQASSTMGGNNFIDPQNYNTWIRIKRTGNY